MSAEKNLRISILTSNECHTSKNDSRKFSAFFFVFTFCRTILMVVVVGVVVVVTICVSDEFSVVLILVVSPLARGLPTPKKCEKFLVTFPLLLCPNAHHIFFLPPHQHQQISFVVITPVTPTTTMFCRFRPSSSSPSCAVRASSARNNNHHHHAPSASLLKNTRVVVGAKCASVGVARRGLLYHPKRGESNV